MANEKLMSALRKLQELGSMDAIATFLLREGFQAAPEYNVMNTSNECPVALYLSAALGEPCYAGISHAGIEDRSDGVVDEPIPELVKDFINAYDNRAYPQLRGDA
jgi:hypothetical protein